MSSDFHCKWHHESKSHNRGLSQSWRCCGTYHEHDNHSCSSDCSWQRSIQGRMLWMWQDGTLQTRLSTQGPMVQEDTYGQEQGSEGTCCLGLFRLYCSS